MSIPLFSEVNPLVASSHDQTGEDVAEYLETDEAGAETDNKSRVGFYFRR